MLGALLQAAANWDDNHGYNWCERKGEKLSRAPPNEAEPVLFSQRGLNTVLIALWCATGVRTPWELVDRVIYVGGDSDTVGAVAGQIACAMLPEAAVVEAFDTVVGLRSTSITAENETAVTMARAAADRYRDRVKLFVKGDLRTLHVTPSMIDSEYPDVTNNDHSS